MTYFILPFLVVSFIFLVLGLINPPIIQKLINTKLNRKQIALIFGTTFLVAFFLISVTTPKPNNNAINTTKITPKVDGVKTQTIGNTTKKDEPKTELINQTPAIPASAPTKTINKNFPSGATARCQDGTYSFAQNHRGACSHHGGVSVWLD